MGPPPSPGEATRGGRDPSSLEFRVRLTHVASINPEYDLYPPFLHQLVLSYLLESFRVSCEASKVLTTPS